MTEQRFVIIQNGDNFTVRDNFENKPMGMFEFKENEFPAYFCFHKIIDLLNELNNENKELRKQLHLTHMASMFSTVKSFKGDVSKRYRYSEETDTIYDTANNYGQYHKMLDKKEITMLLNEYETLLNSDVE